MDNETKLLIFVNEFCNRMAEMEKGMRTMYSYYLFSDKRPGTLQERLDADAREHNEYTKMFQM